MFGPPWSLSLPSSSAVCSGSWSSEQMALAQPLVSEARV